ncbi:Rv2175c family DNA-binding protein [Pseudonocardia ammonioxydans]|uniref:Rv2175c family DNA-binding protein n=1 Tax=Pseudonocardia ammonioxydans TaxID=260086 RepID=UPI001FE2DD3D|nr:Rv2175c family DNA-binding protein [Pseudonocardia ammonioxydans]
MNESLPAAVTEETLAVSDVAARLSIPASRVIQLVRDGQLLSLKHEGEVVVPAVFLDGDEVVRGLSGTIMVLRDGGYDDRDILAWLFTDDESLPGSPIGAIRAGRHKEVKRRAQAMAF